MPVMNVNLFLDEATYAGVKSGMLELCGMVKDTDSKKVRKHLPTVIDATKEGASKAIDIVREHKKGFLIIGGVLIVGGAVAGAVSYVAQKDKIMAKKKFADALEIYLNAAQDGILTSELIENLITALDDVSKYSQKGVIPIKLSSKQLQALFNSIYDFTKRMASANNISTKGITPPSKLTKGKILDLQEYLNKQKEILESAA